MRQEHLFILRNARGMCVAVSQFGAALVAWWAPDRYGQQANVIAAAQETPQRWTGTAAGQSVALRHGQSLLRYQLDDEGNLRVEMESVAQASMPPVPLFNLSGGRACVGDHMLQIHADAYMAHPLDGGEAGMALVGGGAFDFRRPAAVGPRLVWPDAQLAVAGGFDHQFSIGGVPGVLQEAARIFDPRAGRELYVSTTASSLHLRCANALAGLGVGASQFGEHIVRQTTVYRLRAQQGIMR